jgi:hypothetical protein
MLRTAGSQPRNNNPVRGPFFLKPERTLNCKNPLGRVMNIEQDIKGPGVKFAPPMVFILMILLACGMSLFFPVSISKSYGWEGLGLAVAGFGLAVILTAVYSFKRAGTRTSTSVMFLRC